MKRTLHTVPIGHLILKLGPDTIFLILGIHWLPQEILPKKNNPWRKTIPQRLEDKLFFSRFRLKSSEQKADVSPLNHRRRNEC